MRAHLLVAIVRATYALRTWHSALSPRKASRTLGGLFFVIILGLGVFSTVDVYTNGKLPIELGLVAAAAPPPLVRGWGGIFADSPSLQANLDILKARGYNGFRCMIYNSDLGRSPSIASIVNAVNVAKANGLWIILDHHAYTDSFDTDPLWDQTVAAVKDLYPNIIWQPQNEPAYSLPTLTMMYQNWINKVRATGDTHWIVVSIDYQGYGAPGDSSFLSQFPQVMDPLNKIFYDFHDYYFYQYHSAWSVSDAQAYADNVPVAVNSLIQTYGRPVLITETGADASGGGGWPPDTVVQGSAGYAPESLAYVSREVSDLHAINTGYMLWTADDWTGTQGAGTTGALNIWGQYLPFPSASALSTSFTFLPSNPIINSPVTFTALTTGGAGSYTVSWNFGDGAIGTGATATHTYTTAQSFRVSETATDSSSPSQTATSSNSVTVNSPPPLSTSFTFLPVPPVVNTLVTLTTTTTGGTAPYTINWNFGDGATGTGASITHVYSSAQSFTVTETATDSSTPTQTATSSRSITVLATPPLSATFQVSTPDPQVGQTVTFTALASGGTSPYTYTIVFGDGIAGSGSSTTHVYSTPGSYTAKVTVTDLASPQATIVASKTVNVQALIPPTITVPGNQTVTAGSWVNFTVTATSLNMGGAVSLSATGLPAGASFDQTTGFFSWKPSSAQAGSHTIVFTATDSSYSSTPASRPTDIQVNQAAPGGGSNGGNGGSSGGSNGSCPLCGTFPKITTNMWLLLMGGFLGLLTTIAVLTVRARASLERTKRRMRL